MIETTLVDAGIYMFEPDDNSGRWVIRHPKDSYTPNKSKKFDVYIEHPDNPNGEPVVDLGSLQSLETAKIFIHKLHSSNKTYFNLRQEDVH